jgi:type IV secretion system protein VirD4
MTVPNHPLINNRNSYPAASLNNVYGLVKIQQSYNSNSQTHGSASFMKKDEVVALGLDQQGEGKKFCPYLGRVQRGDGSTPSTFLFARSPSSTPLSQNEELPDGNGHLLTVAPTRAGKGTGQIITNLLSWKGSVIVLDVKGENYLLSAGYRTHELRQNVFRFAPFEEDSDIWNPIMSIRANLNWPESTWEEKCQEEEDTVYLANLIISPSGNPDRFWEDEAKNFLEGLLLHVRTTELSLNTDDPDLQHKVRERSMFEVRRLLTLKPESFMSLLGDMSESNRNLVRERGAILERQLSGKGELGRNILSAITNQTEIWSNSRVRRVTYKASEAPSDREPAENDFNFSGLRSGDTTIYLIIPPDQLSEYRSLLRVMTGIAIRDLKNSYHKPKTDPDYQDKPSVLVILDEFPQLAHMSPIEEGLGYLAGYGVRLWFFVQDMSQLKLHYKCSWQSFMANTETKCFFGVNDIETAKLVSEMTGTATVEHYSYTDGTSNGSTYGSYYTQNSQTRSQNSSNTLTHTSRPLLTPDEVMRMPNDMQLIFIKGLRPIFCDIVKFFEFSILYEDSKIAPPQKINFSSSHSPRS